MYPGFKYQSQPNQPRPIILYIQLETTPTNAAVKDVAFIPEDGSGTIPFQYTNTHVLHYSGVYYLTFETYGPTLLTLDTPLIGSFEVTYTLDSLANPLVTESDSLDCTLYPQ